MGILLGDKKFSFAYVGIINFHNFWFVAVQNFKLSFLQKFKFSWKFFDCGIFELGHFRFGILE